MAEADVYLFKAARRPLYRKENLQLLAAERGSDLEVAYNRMWVAPEYLEPNALPRGTKACVVFTERPYAAFVPVRTAEILESATDDIMLRLRLLLRSWVSPADRDVADFIVMLRDSGCGQELRPRRPPPRSSLPFRHHFQQRGWSIRRHFQEPQRRPDGGPLALLPRPDGGATDVQQLAEHRLGDVKTVPDLTDPGR